MAAATVSVYLLTTGVKLTPAKMDSREQNELGFERASGTSPRRERGPSRPWSLVPGQAACGAISDVLGRGLPVSPATLARGGPPPPEFGGSGEVADVAPSPPWGYAVFHSR